MSHPVAVEGPAHASPSTACERVPLGAADDHRILGAGSETRVTGPSNAATGAGTLNTPTVAGHEAESAPGHSR